MEQRHVPTSLAFHGGRNRARAGATGRVRARASQRGKGPAGLVVGCGGTLGLHPGLAPERLEGVQELLVKRRCLQGAGLPEGQSPCVQAWLDLAPIAQGS